MEASYKELLLLPRDGGTYANHWILSDGYTVSVVAQKPGEQPTQSITIPRRVFNALVRFYTKQQPMRKART
jgi:outer membrane receptor for ferric coprogen and ferric-rhodotorulic acid